jgi:hypothetical protein
LKCRADGRRYRIEPVRDPGQPRFWVLRVARCPSVRLIEPPAALWLGPRQMSLTEIRETIALIKSDVGSWLELESQRVLKARLLQEAAVPPAPPAALLIEQGIGAIATGYPPPDNAPALHGQSAAD